MRWLLFFLPVLLCAADLRIDHATVAGRDLKRMVAALEAAGIPMVYGGPHANGVTEMSLCSFPDGSYLEAIAPIPNADPKKVDRHEWAPFLKQDAAACAWATRSDDLKADAARLQKAGIAVSAPVNAGRRRPDGVRLEWATADLGNGQRGGLLPFLIQDFTPRDLRAYPQGKPTTSEFAGLDAVVIAVRDLDAAVAEYRKAFGLPAASLDVDHAFDARLARMPGAPVILAQPLTAESWIGRRLERFGEGPCAFLLRATRDRKTSATSRWFSNPIAWFDEARLGWRLGVVAPRN